MKIGKHLELTPKAIICIAMRRTTTEQNPGGGV